MDEVKSTRISYSTISSIHGVLPVRGEKVDSAFFGFGHHPFATPEAGYQFAVGVIKYTRVWDVWTGSLIWTDGVGDTNYTQRPALSFKNQTS